MPITIRSATVQDAPSIVEIIKRAFEEEASQEQIADCIAQPGFRTLVAESDGKVTGFIFGFLTISIDGKKRRELDLQAVHPDYHGQGTGKKLIQRFTELESDADHIRVLVADGNIRMEKALTRMGYITDDILCGLYVSTNTARNETTPEDSHLIPVTTMTYNGIWLEGKVTSQAINSALSSKQQENDIVGAVVPMTDKTAIESLESANFNFINHYRRWYK